MSPIQFAYGEEGVSVKVFRNSRKLLAGYLLVTAAMLFAPVAKVEAQTGYLYMTDYGDGAMDRFSYTYSAGVYTFTPAGASSTDARWITGQGMNGGFAGNANDLIIATNATSTSGTAGLSRYGLNGALISTLTINNGGFTGGGNGTAQTGTASHTFYGISDVMMSSEGRYLYVAESASATTGIVSKIDLTNNTIVSQISLAGASALYVDNARNSLYVGANTSTTTGVQEYNITTNATMTGAGTSLVGYKSPSGTGGVSGIRDITVIGSTMYLTNQDAVANKGTVISYTLAGAGAGAETATYVSQFKPSGAQPKLANVFGVDVGLDGNLYMGVTGTGSYTGTTPAFTAPRGYVNGVYQYNIAGGSDALTITGATNNGTNTGYTVNAANQLYSPVFVQFSANFTTVNDAGTPEPGTWLTLIAAATAGSFVYKRRARSARK